MSLVLRGVGGGRGGGEVGEGKEVKGGREMRERKGWRERLEGRGWDGEGGIVK